MPWTDQQLAMLKEMGITIWWPGAAAAPLARPDAPRGVASSALTVAAPTVAADAPTPPSLQVAEPVAARRASAAEPAAPAPVNTGRRAPGIEQMDWPALRSAVASCTACALCEGRKQTVFGVGHEQARWMIIGEAPGEQEDRQGEPFVGKAGQLLDRMLAAIDLTRSADSAQRQVFIANVLKCRPPGNRNPLPEEVAQCEPFLKRQVELVQPRIILAMGRFAVQSILRSTLPIGKLRGQVHQYEGVPVIVTYHPAYLLRNPIDKALAWDDLCLAREVVGEPPFVSVAGG